MNIIQHIIGLVETKIELAKMEVKAEVSSIASKLIVAMVIAVVAFFIWFYLSLALGMFLNDVLNTEYAGILIVAGLHLLVLLLLYFFHEQLGLRKAIASGMDKILYSDSDEEHEEDEGTA